jgi:hypothetical protein
VSRVHGRDWEKGDGESLASVRLLTVIHLISTASGHFASEHSIYYRGRMSGPESGAGLPGTILV